MTELLFFADTETTGIPDFKKPADAEGQPRIASMAGILVRASDRRVLSSFDLRVRPDGWTMPPELEKVHGLTTELLTQVGLPIRLVLNQYIHMINIGAVVVFHNAGFDLKLLRGELRRAQYNDDGANPLHICTYKATPQACRQEAGNCRLSTVYTWLTGRQPAASQAHTAMGDTMMVREVYFKLLERGVKIEPTRYKEEV